MDNTLAVDESLLNDTEINDDNDLMLTTEGNEEADTSPKQSEILLTENEVPTEIPSPSKDTRNKWEQRQILSLENYGSPLIDYETVGDRLLLLFQKLTIRECSIICCPIIGNRVAICESSSY